jgi:prepilin-type N-terminal cleavage/methylation domain-containing protein
MEGLARARNSEARGSGNDSGFSLVELLIAIAILGSLAGITALAFGGFDATTSAISCGADRDALKNAQATFHQRNSRFATQAELVDAELIAEPSALHDVTVGPATYTITEVGRCENTDTGFVLAAPTVGTTEFAGVSVAVLQSDGSAVTGAAVTYLDGSWTSMGTTGSSGRVTADIDDGTYDFRVSYRGTTNTLADVHVTKGTLVTFPTVDVRVTLANASGDPQSGGVVAIKSTGGSSTSIGTTGSDGSISANVLPAAYDVTMTYASNSSTRQNVAVNGPTTVAFGMNTLTVRLLSAGGAPLAGGSVVVTPVGGTGISLGATSASGSVSTTVLDGSYTVAMTYGGATTTQTPSVSGPTTVTFQSSAATLQIRSSTGGGVSGGDSALWWRATGSTNWTFAGYPNSSGIVNVTLLSGNYDFRARWIGQLEVQSAVAITPNATVTFQTFAATEHLRSSTGGGVSGGDSAMWAKPTGTSSWFFSGYPNGSGQVVQQLLAGTYDFRARWIGQLEIRVAVEITEDTTVTFQTFAATEYLRSSTGGGVSGGDSAMWVLPTGTSSWFFSGYPNANGQVVQQLLAGTYDFRARWIGQLEIQSGIAITADTTITFQTYGVTEFLRSSTGGGVSGGDSAMWARPTGTTDWTFSGYPNGSGQVVQQLFAGTYDFRARWIGQLEIQSAVPVAADTTVTFQTFAATEHLRSSTGGGVSGGDSAMWARPAGTSSWFFSGYPNGSGQVVQQLLAGTYDFRARWIGVLEVQSAVPVAADTTVTFQTFAATELLRSSTGTGLSGGDSAMWVQPTGTSSYFFSGYPNGSGQVVQQLLAGTYDFRTRWLGMLEVQSGVAIAADTTITFQTAAIDVTVRRTSDNALVSGATTSVITSGGTFFVGYTNGSGQLTAQVLVGTVSVRATSSALTGINNNLVVGSGGISTTVMLA